MAADGSWLVPDWQAPFDDAAALRAIPATATMTGMFLDAVAKLGRDNGFSAPSARARYTPFQPYPLLEHCRILLEVAHAVYAKLPVREALRRLGRGAPYVLMGSTVGRVVLGSAEGPMATLEAMTRSYVLHMRPGVVSIEVLSDHSAIIRLDEIYNFLDCHNVGVFEGALNYIEVKGTVRIARRTATSADLLCEW